MLSREADHCFWLGRYMERAEATARMLDVHFHAGLEAGSHLAAGDVMTRVFGWESILAISGDAETFHEKHAEVNDRNVLEFFGFDQDHPNSILSCLSQARDNARAIRDQVATELWQVLNASWLRLRDWNPDRVLHETPGAWFQAVKDASHLFRGVVARTLPRGEARDWIEMGVALERGGQTARLVDVKYHDLLPGVPEQRPVGDPLGVGGPLDLHGWATVLRSVSGYEIFRRTYQVGLRPDRVVEFLLLHPEFPASLRHCVLSLEERLHRMTDGHVDHPKNECDRLVGKLRADLAYARADEIILGGLHEFLEDVQDRLDRVGASLIRQYLMV